VFGGFCLLGGGWGGLLGGVGGGGVLWGGFFWGGVLGGLGCWGGGLCVEGLVWWGFRGGFWGGFGGVGGGGGLGLAVYTKPQLISKCKFPRKKAKRGSNFEEP